MDGDILPPPSAAGVSGVVDGGQAQAPAGNGESDAAALERLLWLYGQKFEIEKAIFGLLRKICPESAA